MILFPLTNQVGIWYQNDVVSTPMQLNHVASTVIFTSFARWEALYNTETNSNVCITTFAQGSDLTYCKLHLYVVL